MLSRIFTAVIAVVLTGLAIGVPIMLTEAGSTSTSTGKTLDAAFRHEDPSTGEVTQVFISAYTQTSTFKSTDDGGLGGSSRARSQRPNNSDRPHPSTPAPTFTAVDVFIDIYDAQGNFIRFGSGSAAPESLNFADDLSAGSVLAHVPVELYSASTGDLIDELDVDVDLDFAATGPLVVGRDHFSEVITSPRQRYSFRGTNSHREAEATGVVEWFGVNVAANGSDFAQIATFQSTSSVRP